MRVLILLTMVALPVCAEELQFDLQGSNQRGQPFEVSFTLDTLSGPSAFTFAPGGCLAQWSFSDARVTDLSATVGGQSVLTAASTAGSGGGSLDAPNNCTMQAGDIFLAAGFLWEDIRTDPTPALGSTDPLAAFLRQIQGNTGELRGSQLQVRSVRVTPVGVAEPGLLALLLLGLTAIELRRRSFRHH